MSNEDFSVPEIDFFEGGFGGEFESPLNVHGVDLNTLRSAGLKEALIKAEYLIGRAVGRHSVSVGMRDRTAELASMIAHGDCVARALSEPKFEGRTGRTILFRNRVREKIMSAGLNFIEENGGLTSEVYAQLDLIGDARFLVPSLSPNIAMILGPSIEGKWELVMAYQAVVMEAAGNDYVALDWTHDFGQRGRLIGFMSPWLMHMREVTSRDDFETPSSLCVNNLAL